MDKGKISIIVPAYNIEQYLQRCLDSILCQTYSDLEVIVVNDGSTDHTAEVLEAAAKKDKRIVAIHQPNGGVTKARLEGIRNATGDYIGFVDGDDVIELDMYERLLNNAVKYHADISHCGYQMVFPDRVDYYYNTGRLVQQDKITGLKNLLSGSFIEPGLGNKLFHKSLFHSLLHGGQMDLKIKNYEDLLMNYFLFKESNHSVYEDWCPYHYLVRKGSATSAQLSAQKLTDPINVLSYIENETAQEPELQQVVLQRLTCQLITLASNDLNHQKELYTVRQSARKTLRKRLPEILNCPICSKKNKVAVLWVSVWPWSYGMVHRVYAHMTGIDKKYSVE